jgi:hypothetical protein
MNLPKLGSAWRHLKTGHTYIVKGIANREADLVPLVIYEREINPTEQWSRPAAEFMDGRFQEMIFKMPPYREDDELTVEKAADMVADKLLERATDELDPSIKPFIKATEAELKEGVKLDAGKHRIDLIAPELIFAVAAVATFGAFKYSERNWEKGMKWGRVFAACMRHLWAWWGGKLPTTMNYLLGELDGETKMSHLWHAGWCIMVLIAYEQRGVGTDDRMGRADELA